MFDDFPAQFASNPALFPQIYDAEQDRILISNISKAEFEAASFLDQRIFTPQMQRFWVGWDQLAEYSGEIFASPNKPDYIFHIGHVGSTLISRLLGALPSVFALREPLLLRTLAETKFALTTPSPPWSQSQYEQRLRQTITWISRSFDPAETPMIKATSSVSEIASDLIGHGRRSLFLCVKPERYLETILAGPASLNELDIVSAPRLARLNARLGGTSWELAHMNQATRIAMNWACEMAALEEAAQKNDMDDIFWLDFDDFLASPKSSLSQLAHFFGHEAPSTMIEQITSGPMMNQYSKAPEYEYSTELRQQLLAETRAAEKSNIATALAWLETAGQDHSLIAKSLARSA